MEAVFSFDDFIAGWIGGICGLVVGHPLETVKVRQQAYGSSFVTAISRTFRHEGIKGFFKGLALPLYTMGPSNGIFFGIYGNILHILQHNHRVISYTDIAAIGHVYMAGSVAGFFQTIFLCPVELIKTNLQAKTEGSTSWRKHYQLPYTGSFDAAKGIFKEQGIKGFYRGMVPLLFRDVPTYGLYVLTYEMLLHYSFSKCETPDLIKQTIAGGTAGVLSWIVVLPLDVVKCRLQIDHPYIPKYKGMMDCFHKIYRNEGFRAFFKGAPAILMRTFPVNASIFIGYETTLKYLTIEKF